MFVFVCLCMFAIAPPSSSRPLCFPLRLFIVLVQKGVCTASMGIVTLKVKGKKPRACTPYELRLVYPFLFFPAGMQNGMAKCALMAGGYTGVIWLVGLLVDGWVGWLG